MDRDVAIGVTEKISEELVNSGRFMVLDRTTVAKTLEEIEFQMSGLVSDEDIRKAGDQLGSRLGAAFVVVARVSQVGDTFFVSAKMVDVKTGEITAQASDESEGKIAVTLKIAQNVGRKLAAGAKEPLPEPAPAVVSKPQQKQPEPAPAVEPVEKPAKRPGALRSHIAAYYSRPFISGDIEDNTLSLWPVASTTGFGIGNALQFTAGVHAGFAGYTAGSFWADEGDSYSGYAFGVEAAVDWAIFDRLALCVRVDWSSATIELVTESWVNLQIGVGWAYGRK